MKVLQYGGGGGSRNPCPKELARCWDMDTAPCSQPLALLHLPCSEGEILKSFNSIKSCSRCQLNKRIARTSAFPSPKAEPSLKHFTGSGRREAEDAG